MTLRLKRIADQVIVIVGASSGIGLATAEAAAARGARLVVAARSGRALEDLVGRFRAAGCQAVAVECDVADRSQVECVAGEALARFGRIDTWVNVAGLGLYGRLDEVSDADSRRLFDINFWGVVYGSLAALPHLKKNGGAIINVGSEVSEAYVPMLGMYTASKHAVKGFTDSLRVEVERLDKAPVSITLIQPTAVDTPFPQHARNYMSEEASLPHPQIEPSQVAEAILDAATRPTRAKRVGVMAKVNTSLASLAPAVADRLSAMEESQLHGKGRPRHPEGALNQPSEATGVAGRKRGLGSPEEGGDGHGRAGVLARAGLGAAGGLVGTLALQALMAAGKKYIPQASPPMRQEPGEFMVEQAEAALPEGVAEKIPEAAEMAAATGLGLGYGVAFGALYAAVCPRGGNALLGGAALGLGCWAAGYLGWLPALGLTPPLTRQSAPQVAGPVVDHLAYGVATAAAYDWLSDRLAPA